jgi:HEAT repeat protein
VIRAIVRAEPTAEVAGHLGAPWPALRSAAAEELGHRDDWTRVPLLLRGLEDPDPGVRAAGAAALRRLTNEFHGFEARAPLAARRVAASRWRDWWNRVGALKAREHGPTARGPAE